MGEQNPASLMRKSMGAIAARDADALSATHHAQIIENFIVLGPVEGKASVKAFFAELFAAAPDLEFTIERVMGVDDTTAVGQWRMKGTLTGGSFQSIEPNGRTLDIRGIDVMEFEDGLLRNNTIYYDGLSFARQIGLLPLPLAGATRRSWVVSMPSPRSRRHSGAASGRLLGALALLRYSGTITGTLGKSAGPKPSSEDAGS